MSEEKTLLEIKRTPRGITCSCTMTNPMEHIEIIMLLSEIREKLVKSMDSYMTDMLDKPEVPESLKDMIRNNSSSSEISGLMDKVINVKSKEEREQLVKDIKGLIEGK